ELRILSFAHRAIVTLDRRDELGLVDAGLPCEFGKGAAAQEIARAQIGRERQRERLDETHAVAPQRRMIADEPGGGCTVVLTGAHHALDEIVIGVAFIDKALAAPRHRDDAGLLPVDEMREEAGAPVAMRHARHGTQAAGLGNPSLMPPPTL